MSTAASKQVQVIDLAIEQLVELAGGPQALVTPSGTSHLGLAIIEAVVNTGGADATSAPLLRRYADSVPGFERSDHFSDDLPWHGASALSRFLTSASADERYRLLGQQAEVVLRLAAVLLEHGIDDGDDLARGVRLSHQLEPDVLALADVDRPTWHRLLSYSRGDWVRPDSAVLEWVRIILFDESITTTQACQLIRAATRNIQDRGASYSIRAVDHLIRLDASELGGN